MPTTAEIEAAARLMCRQNNEIPDLHPGPHGTNRRPLWMNYRRKAERILLAAEEARKRKPGRCSHPEVLRELYDGERQWTCTQCSEHVPPPSWIGESVENDTPTIANADGTAIS